MTLSVADAEDRGPSDAPETHARPIRLLTLTTLFPNNRRPRHGIFVANRLRRLCDTGRIEATVVAALPWFPGAYRQSSAVAERDNVMGIDVFHPRYLNIPGIGMRAQPDSLARALLEALRRHNLGANRFDVVDAHYFYPDGVAAACVADALGLPLTITARGTDVNLIGDIPFARKRMRNAAQRAQALIAVSSALAQKMIALGMPGDRIHVMRNGVDADLFAPVDRREARRRIGLRDDGTWVIGVGNLVPEKGFELLIRATALLDEARLLIVGEGPERGALESLAQSVAPGRVEFRDNVSQAELRYVYAAGDVLGLPSLREGWPNVLLEAIACGTPVVASPVGGVPEMIDASAPAILVPDRTIGAWTRAIRMLIAKPLAPSSVRKHALGYGWDEVVDKQCAIYESIGSMRTSKADRRSV